MNTYREEGSTVLIKSGHSMPSKTEIIIKGLGIFESFYKQTETLRSFDKISISELF